MREGGLYLAAWERRSPTTWLAPGNRAKRRIPTAWPGVACGPRARRTPVASIYGRAQWLIGASPGCLPGGGGQTFKSRYVWIVWVWVSASGLERAWPMGAAAVPGLARGEGRDERAPRRWVRQPFP